MLRLILEQVFRQVFERALEPLDRERIQALVQEALASDEPEVLRDLVKELAMIGPMQRSLSDVLDRLKGGKESP
jgi:hypothetical protein